MSCDISINVSDSSVTIDCGSVAPTGNGAPPPAPGFAWFTADVGDGTSTSFPVAHGLGSTDVVVSVHSNTTGLVNGDSTVTITDPNTLTVDFVSPPGVGERRVVILARV